MKWLKSSTSLLCSWSDLLYYTAVARPKRKLDWSTDREFGRTSLLPLLLLVSRSSSRTKKGDIFIDLCRLEQVVCLAIAVSAKTAFALFSPTLPGLLALC